MRKVLLLTDDMRQGGAERQLAYLAVELKRAGCDVRLVQFYDTPPAYSDMLDKGGVTIETRTDGRSKLRRPLVIASIAREWRPDAVIAYKDGCCMAACIARMLCRFNLIVSERNTTQRLSAREMLKFSLYRLATHVVPNSESQGRFIMSNARWLRHKVRVISNMLDMEMFHPAATPPDGIPTVLTMARIAPQKNVIRYIDAIKLLKAKGVKAHFDWYGRAESEDYHREVMRHVAETGVGDMLTFHGPTGNAAEAYRAATHFCLPSNFEGFANVLCEAMASGLLCVASDTCDNPRILSVPGRLFSPSDTEAIAAALADAISVPAARRVEYGRENRRLIAALCSPEVFTSSYLQLIDNSKSRSHDR